MYSDKAKLWILDYEKLDLNSKFKLQGIHWFQVLKNCQVGLIFKKVDELWIRPRPDF